MNKDKIALVIWWWWMWASYAVWCVLALVKEYNLTKPDIVVAGSGSSGTMSYYVAKQYKEIKHIWEDLLSTKKFLNTRRLHKIIDIDYLIDVVFKKQCPLDIDAIKNSPIAYYISATNANTWKVEFFSNHENNDIFELMRASKAMPVFYWKKVNINNQCYIDSPNSTSCDLLLQKALELWANKVIVIDTGKRTSQWKTKIYLSMNNNLFCKWYLSDYKKRFINKIPDNVEILRISPNIPTRVWVLDNNKSRLVSTIKQGYAETIKTIWSTNNFIHQ